MRVAAFFGVMLLAAPALAQAPNPSFNLANRGGQAINEVYATPAGVDRWGRDRLGNNSLPPGSSFPVRLPADGNCVYDIRVVFADGQAEEKRRINTCRIETVVFPGGRPSGSAAEGGRDGSGRDGGGREGGRAAAPSDDPSFRLVNRGRVQVNEVYVSPTGDDSWGRDRLGDDVVAVGATRVIRLPAGDCQYDVRVVFSNGEATEKRRLNLCTITDLRVP
jgi:hypothetical protein